MIFDLDKVRLAHKLNPAPIIEAIVEIRFESTLSFSDVIDRLLLEFGKGYSIKNLPLLEIPEAIRTADPQFRYIPVKQLIKDGLILQIGGRVISFVNKGSYIGWSSLKPQIQLMIDTLKNANVASKYIRLGVRYLNVVNSNILGHINLSISTPMKKIIEERLDLRLGLTYKEFMADVRLSNNIHTITRGEKVSGTLIDIDSFVDSFAEEKIFEFVDKLHDFEKRIFFALVKEDYIQKNFDPEWIKT